MHRIKMLSVLGVLAALMGGVMLSAGPAWAAAVDCSTITTVSQWDTANVCRQQDKDWTLIGTPTVPGNTGTTFELIPLGGIDFHKLTFTFTPSLTNTSLSIDYNISINETAPDAFFLKARIDTDVVNPNSNVTKDINTGDFVLASINGVPGGPVDLLPPAIRSLDVHETFVVDSTGILSSATNTYTEALSAPEPASILLMGLGLVGLALLRRKKSA